MLFSHPADFTPVCTTEFSAAACRADEFAQRNCKLVGSSVDGVEEHRKWMTDVESCGGTAMRFPLIADPELKVAKLYDMLPAEAWLPDERTADHTATERTTFIIGPDKKIRLMLICPVSLGRNFDDILRAFDAIRATDGAPFATPADWRPGQDVIISLKVPTDEPRARFGQIDVPLPYLRTTRLPG